MTRTKPTPAGETFDSGLTKEENNKNGFENFGAKLNSQQLTEYKLAGWMINEHSGWTGGGFLHRALNCLALLVRGWEVFKADGISPVFCGENGRQDALSYARQRVGSAMHRRKSRCSMIVGTLLRAFNRRLCAV